MSCLSQQRKAESGNQRSPGSARAGRHLLSMCKALGSIPALQKYTGLLAILRERRKRGVSLLWVPVILGKEDEVGQTFQVFEVQATDLTLPSFSKSRDEPLPSKLTLPKSLATTGLVTEHADYVPSLAPSSRKPSLMAAHKLGCVSLLPPDTSPHPLPVPQSRI